MFLSVLSAFDQEHGVSNHDSHQEFTIAVKKLPDLQTESLRLIHLLPLQYGLNLDLTDCIFYVLDDLCYYQICIEKCFWFLCAAASQSWKEMIVFVYIYFENLEILKF